MSRSERPGTNLRAARAGLLGEIGRYGAVVVAGFVIDLGLATLLAGILPLWLAASLGFAAALVFNFVAHSLWTFREAAPAPRLRRAGKFLLGALATLGLRLAALAAFERLAPPSLDHPALLLTAAAGLSLVANFLILRVAVFVAPASSASDSR